jgi:hypothetical protein
VYLIEVKPLMAKIEKIKADFFALAKNFGGRWVALDPDSHEVLASGSTAKEALESAGTKGYDRPLVFKVLTDYGALAPCLGL